MKAAERKSLRDKLLLAQGGICPICGHGSDYCYFHARGVEHSGECKTQPVCVLEHNHRHCKDGCEECIRGVVHHACNRYIAFVEANPQARDRLVTPWLEKFLAKGTVP
jgi:hypothetical protein